MAEEAEQAPAVEQENTEQTEETVPKERYISLSKNKKAAEDRAKALEKDMADLRAQMDERETAGLPELERERKRAEQLEKRIQDAEKRAEDAERSVHRGQRERWITTAAQAQNFADPSDAAAFVNLDDIEDEKDAERAVRKLAGSKKHLLKSEEPKLPGRVLKDGRTDTNERRQTGIDPRADAQILADGLRQFASRQAQ